MTHSNGQSCVYMELCNWCPSVTAGFCSLIAVWISCISPSVCTTLQQIGKLMKRQLTWSDVWTAGVSVCTHIICPAFSLSFLSRRLVRIGFLKPKRLCFSFLFSHLPSATLHVSTGADAPLACALFQLLISVHPSIHTNLSFREKPVI